MPTSAKVVGSVVTTEGIKAALLERSDVAHVELVYPFTYDRFFFWSWDLIIIEGWFTGIHIFLNIARIHSPRAKILFYCLDPAFPHLNETLSLNVDGFFTNSEELAETLQQRAPTRFTMLAADPLSMSPDIGVKSGIKRTFGSIYVGVGGLMLDSKPNLLGMLQGAMTAPLGLRLHGAHWNEVPSMAGAASGLPLPPGKIAEAYASAHVVLGVIVEAQRQYGMINNRVFEALACGCILVSDHSPQLEDLFGEFLLFANDSAGVAAAITRVIDDPDWANHRRVAGRTAILRAHTWAHRVVDMLSFYHELRWEKGLHVPRFQVGFSPSTPTALAPGDSPRKRATRSRLLWVVSASLKTYETFVREKLTTIPGIAGIESSFAFGQVKRTAAFPNLAHFKE